MASSLAPSTRWSAFYPWGAGGLPRGRGLRERGNTTPAGARGPAAKLNLSRGGRASRLAPEQTGDRHEHHLTSAPHRISTPHRPRHPGPEDHFPYPPGRGARHRRDRQPAEPGRGCAGLRDDGRAGRRGHGQPGDPTRHGHGQRRRRDLAGRADRGRGRPARCRRRPAGPPGCARLAGPSRPRPPDVPHIDRRSRPPARPPRTSESSAGTGAATIRAPAGLAQAGCWRG